MVSVPSSWTVKQERIVKRTILEWFTTEKPGSGKSHSARAWLRGMMVSYGDALVYCNVIFTPSGFYLDYDGGRYVLIDDWEPRSLPPEAWNRLLDDYRTKVNIKAGEIVWKPRYIAITRIHMPQDLVQYGLKVTDLVQIRHGPSVESPAPLARISFHLF